MHDARRSFRLPYDWSPTLTPTRRQYVHSFFRQQGYRVVGLDDAQLTSVFSLLARVEEYTTHQRHNGHNWELDYAPDVMGRSAARPLIDEWIHEWATAGKVRPLLSARALWPGGKRFALCLTHDMDTLCGDVFWHRARSLPLYRKAPMREKAIVAASTVRALIRKCVPGLRRPDPLLSEWMAEEDRHGFRSSCFFFAQPIPAPDWQDSFDHYDDYVTFDGNRVAIREVMKSMVDGGWDVGLHGSSNSHASASLLARERNIVSEACGREVVTTRQHHLFFDARFTPLYQSQAGLLADSTVGSNNRSCFRCGSGRPFFWYDLIDDRELDLLIVPLVVQDVALFNVLQMNVETALHHCTTLLRHVANLGGAITLLWHNNYYPGDDAFTVYKTLLDEARNLNAWGCSLRQLRQWWDQRRTDVHSELKIAS
jgi:hypothetical protein